MDSQYYTAPKKPKISGLLALSGGVLLTGVVFAPVYLFGVWKAPYDILAGAIALVYGLVLSFVAYQIIKKLVMPNKIHNILVFLFSYLLLTYVKWSYYASFVEHYILYSQQSFVNYFNRFFDFFLSPINMIVIMQFLYNNGVWTLGESTINGSFLLLVWLGEFAFIAMCVILIIVEKFDLPTVSEGKEWAMEYTDGIIAFQYFKITDHRERIETNPSFITESRFKRIENPGNEDHVRVRLFFAQDHSEHFITIQEEKYDRRNRQFNTKKQMKRLRIHRTLANELMKDISEGDNHDNQE